MFNNCARGTKQLLKTVNGGISVHQHRLKTQATTIKKKDTKGRSKQPTAQKMHRHWEPIKSNTASQVKQQPHPPGSNVIPAKQYTLLSYNILAQDLLTEHLQLYLGTPPQLLRWEERLTRLVSEVQNLNPDILCLQEMQYDHLKQFVARIRAQRRLEYVFKKRTGARTDGCAIIYDRDKFRLLEERAIEYHEPDVPSLNRENVALLAKFQLREEPAKRVVVATTHLLYNPRRDDVRCAQVESLLAALSVFSRSGGGSGDKAKGGSSELSLPILLTGDFNSQPHSPTYALLTAQHPLTSSSLSKSQRRKEDSLQLTAVNFGHNCASTHQCEWITVDYMLQSIGGGKWRRGQVQVWSIYKLPAITACQRMGKIPNLFVGSDHFSQAIRFSVN